jgi:large subunit ribosomal protein L24
MKLKKGDTVKVLYGKDSGKTGKIVRVMQKSSKVVVDGVNIFKKHVKGDGQRRTSDIVEIVKPMGVAKLMVVCPDCGKTSRVVMKEIEGKMVRVCRKCGKSLDAVKAEKKVVEKKVTKKSNVKKAE